MNILTLDFETYFDDEYTLKRLTTEDYIRNPRFEALGVGLRHDTGFTEWVPQELIKGYFAQFDWDNTAVLMHHAHFDALILSHHYSIKPRFIYDTLSMARLQLGNHISVGLESLARHYGLAPKNVPYDRMRGLHWADMDSGLRAELVAGCLHDAALTWGIFSRLAQGFPAEEYQVIDMTVRMFTEPQLEGDVDVFGRVWTFERARKEALLRKLALDPAALQSADRFATLLRSAGIEPETKSGKNGVIYAFAKTDEFMQGLLEHDDERVRTLAECRLRLKSTLDQTRAERLGFMATRGPMPVYLSYCAAHTTRWGGGDKVNWQNFKRGSDLRKGCHAPAGYKIVKADKSQIECRILEMVAGETEGIEEFRRGGDPYVGLASAFYHREITKADKEERQFGKVMRLQCGFGAGGDSIVRAAKRAAIPVIITPAQGLEARDLYRSQKPGVVNYWKQGGRLISAIAGTTQPIQWGPLRVETGVIYRNDIPIRYPELHYYMPQANEEAYWNAPFYENERPGYWRYKTRKGWAKLYGGKLVENVVQFMSRVDMSQSLLRILARTGIRPAQLEHDAAVWVVREDLLTPFTQVVEQEMTRAPVWLPGIPLACEVTVGETM